MTKKEIKSELSELNNRLKKADEYFKNNGCPFIEIIVDKYRTGTTGSQYYLFEGKTMNYFPIG